MGNKAKSAQLIQAAQSDAEQKNDTFERLLSSLLHSSVSRYILGNNQQDLLLEKIDRETLKKK